MYRRIWREYAARREAAVESLFPGDGLVVRYPGRLPPCVAKRVRNFGIREPNEFLAELRRILKPGGGLIIDGGRIPLAMTRRRVMASGRWKLVREEHDHLRLTPV